MKPMTNENELYESVLCGHIGFIIWQIRQTPREQFDFTFAPPAPSPRTVAVHAWQWLICDRNHINEPDASRHPRVPDPPEDKDALADAIAEEKENWHQLIRSLTPEKLEEPRLQFNDPETRWNVRGFLAHIIQNTIYKSGQMSTTFYGLGLDGTEPYKAPFPNEIYEELGLWKHLTN